MIVHFTQSEYGAIVAALREARPELEVDSALSKLESCGGRFTLVTGEDALKARSGGPPMSSTAGGR